MHKKIMGQLYDAICIIYIMQHNNNVNESQLYKIAWMTQNSEWIFKTQKYIFIEIYLYKKKFLLKYIHVLRPQNCTSTPNLFF